MSVYLDASVILPMIVEEPATAGVDAFFGTETSTPIVSEFAAAEVYSAVSRLSRTGELDLKTALASLADFDAWRAAEAKLIDVEGADVRVAGLMVRRFELKLRAPDALHLAICRRLDALLITRDRRLARAAASLDIEATLLP